VVSSPAQAVKVRIELLDVRCHDTEDVTGTDELFVVAALRDGRQTRGLVPRPIAINPGQTRTFTKDQRVIFEGKVPRGRTVKGGLITYDEDYAKGAASRGRRLRGVGGGFAGSAASRGLAWFPVFAGRRLREVVKNAALIGTE